MCSVYNDSNAVSKGQVVTRDYTSKTKNVQKPGIVALKKEKENNGINTRTYYKILRFERCWRGGGV